MVVLDWATNIDYTTHLPNKPQWKGGHVDLLNLRQLDSSREAYPWQFARLRRRILWDRLQLAGDLR